MDIRQRAEAVTRGMKAHGCLRDCCAPCQYCIQLIVDGWRAGGEGIDVSARAAAIARGEICQGEPRCGVEGPLCLYCAELAASIERLAREAQAEQRQADAAKVGPLLMLLMQGGLTHDAQDYMQQHGLRIEFVNGEPVLARAIEEDRQP